MTVNNLACIEPTPVKNSLCYSQEHTCQKYILGEK